MTIEIMVMNIPVKTATAQDLTGAARNYGVTQRTSSSIRSCTMCECLRMPHNRHDRTYTRGVVYSDYRLVSARLHCASLYAESCSQHGSGAVQVRCSDPPRGLTSSTCKLSTAQPSTCHVLLCIHVPRGRPHTFTPLATRSPRHHETSSDKLRTKRRAAPHVKGGELDVEREQAVVVFPEWYRTPIHGLNNGTTTAPNNEQVHRAPQASDACRLSVNHHNHDCSARTCHVRAMSTCT